jgi:hypothetical protein
MCNDEGGRVDRGAIVCGSLGLPGFRVERVDGEDGDATSRVQIRIERRGAG